MGQDGVRGITERWIRGYVPAAAALLAVSIALGYLLGTQVPAELLQGEAGGSPFFPGEITFQTIAINNLIAITVTLLGAVSIGLVSGFVLVLNGVVVGAVVQIALREVSGLTVFLLIAPHGIVEIPAILLVAAIGFRFGHRTYMYVRGRTDEHRDGPRDQRGRHHLRCCRRDDRGRGVDRGRGDASTGTTGRWVSVSYHQ